MLLLNLLEKVNKIDAKVNYWLVRTDGGKYFDTYYENNFIAIGWDEITLDDLTNRTMMEVKEKIARTMGYDIVRDIRKVSFIYNKLINFKNLAKNDIVLIPSNSSDKYAFSIVRETAVYVDLKRSYHCPHYKRKKIEWVTKKQASELDSIFYKIKVTRHAISSITEHAGYIDKIMHGLYQKGDFSHLVFDITEKDDINLKALISLVSSAQILIEKINRDFDFKEEVEKSSIKLSLQSPGLVELILREGKTLIVLASIMQLYSCRNDVEQPNIPRSQEIQHFIEQNPDEVDTLNNALETLKADRNKMQRLIL